MLMRTKNMLLTSAVIGLAVVAGLLGVGGTWALWNASVESNPGAVQAANFDIKVDQSIPANGANVSIALEESAAVLTPHSSVYAVVTVANESNASSPFAVRATFGNPSATPASLGEHLTLQVAAQSAATCAKSAFPGQQLAPIQNDKPATYCLKIGLSPSVPPSAMGKNTTIQIPLTVSQM